MASNLFDLTDRVAIVTGAGRGMGKAIALGLAEAGANVVVAARTAADIEAVASQIRATGRQALAVPSDVQLAGPVASLVKKTLDRFGRIDILVNNAGATRLKFFMDMKESDWDALIQAELKSVYLCTSAVVKVMAGQGGGSIINVASMAGVVPHLGFSHHSAAKAGVIHFTRTVAAEVGKHHIRVNAIAPGYIETAATAPWFQALRAHHPQRWASLVLGTIPLGRVGAPEDVVGTVVYLASAAASYVSGTTIEVSGGLLALLDLTKDL